MDGRHGLHHQVPCVLIGELRGVQALLRRFVSLPRRVIENGQGSVRAQIAIVKRTDDGGNARKIEAKRFEIDLLIDLADLPLDLRQQSAESPLPLSAGALT